MAQKIIGYHFTKKFKKQYKVLPKEIQKAYDALKDQFKAATAKQMKEDSPSYFG